MKLQKSSARKQKWLQFCSPHLAWLRVRKSGHPQMTFLAPLGPKVVLVVSRNPYIRCFTAYIVRHNHHSRLGCSLTQNTCWLRRSFSVQHVLVKALKSTFYHLRPAFLLHPDLYCRLLSPYSLLPTNLHPNSVLVRGGTTRLPKWPSPKGSVNKCLWRQISIYFQ